MCVCVRVRLSTFIMICHAFLCPLFITISMYRRSATCPSPHFDSRSSLFIQLFFFSKFSLVAAFQNERINIIFHLFGFFFPFDVGRLLSTIFSKCGKKNTPVVHHCCYIHFSANCTFATVIYSSRPKSIQNSVILIDFTLEFTRNDERNFFV